MREFVPKSYELNSLKYSSEVVKLLLANGADKTIKDQKGDTALDYANEKYHNMIADLLMDE